MIVKKGYGFTLVELLVSVVILFSVVSTMSLIYSGAYKSSDKATQYVEIAGIMPSLLEQVRFNIRHAPYFENEIIRDGTNGIVMYHWIAKMQQTKAYTSNPQVNEFNISSTDGNEYKLWKIEMTLKVDSIEQSYVFHEVSWRER